jgi:hypothetical protein
MDNRSGYGAAPPATSASSRAVCLGDDRRRGGRSDVQADEELVSMNTEWDYTTLADAYLKRPGASRNGRITSLNS